MSFEYGLWKIFSRNYLSALLEMRMVERAYRSPDGDFSSTLNSCTIVDVFFLLIK